MVSYYCIMHASLLLQVMVSLPQYQSRNTVFSDARGNASTAMIIMPAMKLPCQHQPYFNY